MSFFQKLFQDNFKWVERFGSRSEQTFCSASKPGFKLFAEVISRQQNAFYIPGLAILNLTDSGSFFLHFTISSSIFTILAGLRAHRQPFLVWVPTGLALSTFAKHLFNERLCRTEFWKDSNTITLIKRYSIYMGESSKFPKSWTLKIIS